MNVLSLLTSAGFHTVELDGGKMEYLRFGHGKKALVMLPGLGESLRSLKGMAAPMALMYRMFAEEYTVWVFARRQGLEHGCSTADMADDLAEAMVRLGIGQACVLGVSMGGMIAQHLAASHGELVEKLILTVSCAGPNETLERSVSEWMRLARKGEHAAFMESNLRLIYSDSYYKKNKWMTPVLGLLTKPKSYEPFLIQAEACIGHDAREKLGDISCPTLIIGGERDMTVSPDESRELHRLIAGSELYMYEDLGHGLYEEAGDFTGRVLEFFGRA